MPAAVAQHDASCRYGREDGCGGGHSDAAKRIADAYMLHRTAGAGLGLDHVGKVLAARLDDGSSDGVLYDSKRDAARHQHHNEKYFAYLRIGREGMSVCDAASLLKIHRDAFAAGLDFTDPDDGMFGAELIPRLTTEDHQQMTAALAAGTWIPGRTR